MVWIDGHWAKVVLVRDEIERLAAGFGERFDLGTLTCACAVGYLDFRFHDLPWRASCPKAAA